MSWLSSIGNAIGGAVKKVGSVVGTVGKTVLNVAKASVVPLASFAAGLVPGVGPLLSQGVDMLGNALLGGAGGSAESTAEEAPSPVESLMQTGAVASMSLGSSPAAQALANATSPEVKSGSGFLGKLSDITGIGDGKPGVFGIGDGKPGVFGIGTGKAKAKKEAADVARAQAEDAAKGQGLTPNQIKLAGDDAAAKAEAKVEKEYVAPDKNDTASDSGNKSLIYLVLAALGLAIL